MQPDNKTGLPNFFLAGCQKTASTWLHRCFQEHPQIFVPEEDATHYFTFNYYRGIQWYKNLYKNYSGELAVGDTTPSYIRDFDAPERIFKFNNQSKIIFTLRNPVYRAFSQYWHEKAKGKIKYEFSEVLENYDLYQNYIVSGFYHQQIERYYKYFPKEQILIMLFEELKTDPEIFIKKVFKFINVDTDFVPSVLNEKINPAAAKIKKNHLKNNGYINKKIYKLNKEIYNSENKKFYIKIIRFFKNNYRKIMNYYFGDNKSEYERGIDQEVLLTLNKIFKTENEKLQKLVDIDISSWKN